MMSEPHDSKLVKAWGGPPLAADGIRVRRCGACRSMLVIELLAEDGTVFADGHLGQEGAQRLGMDLRRLRLALEEWAR